VQRDRLRQQQYWANTKHSKGGGGDMTKHSHFQHAGLGIPVREYEEHISEEYLETQNSMTNIGNDSSVHINTNNQSALDSGIYDDSNVSTVIASCPSSTPASTSVSGICQKPIRLDSACNTLMVSTQDVKCGQDDYERQNTCTQSDSQVDNLSTKVQTIKAKTREKIRCDALSQIDDIPKYHVSTMTDQTQSMAKSTEIDHPRGAQSKTAVQRVNKTVNDEENINNFQTMENNRQESTFHDKEGQDVNLDTTTSPTEENGMDSGRSFLEYTAIKINSKLQEFTESMAQINAAEERHLTRLDKIRNKSEIT
jgi:hypothetical protein